MDFHADGLSDVAALDGQSPFCRVGDQTGCGLPGDFNVDIDEAVDFLARIGLPTNLNHDEAWARVTKQEGKKRAFFARHSTKQNTPWADFHALL